MPYMKKFLLLSLLSIYCVVIKAQVVINEIMQSNIDCIMDDMNQFPDSWVEIYNGTSSAINLSSYKLGLTDDPMAAYQLPSRSVPANSYAIIYCDKEATGYHTDFRLDSGKGGAVYLFKGSEIVDKILKIAKQPAPNIAYGRITDGASEFGYQEVPTPGAANCGKVCEKILGEPVFDVAGTVFTSSKRIVLHLSLPEGAPEGTVIVYTLDGSEPSLTNGTIYNTPITLYNSTRVVRATLFCEGYLSPRSTVQSYIFLNRAQTLPVFSIVTDEKYLTDKKIGIYVDGNYSSGKKNFEYDWRRPMNIELYETDGTTQAFNQLGEMRIMGGQSRNATLKSLAVYANKRFGEKRFEYEFFPDQRPGETKFKSFLLRNAGNDFDYLYMRDAIIQRTMSSHVDIDWQAWRPAIVYINGTYRGILNIRERSNDDNVYTNYNGLEDIDMIENSSELKAGTWDNFNAFKEFYAEHGHTMAEYAKWIDVNEFINIYAMNLFYNNQDWPGNNTVWWRPATEDGVWRIIAKDTDFGLGLYGSPSNYNTMAWFYNPNYDSGRNWANSYDDTRLFRRLMEDSDFQREFIDHCAIYMGDFMNSKGTRELWDPMYEIIKTEYPIHRKLFNEWWPNYNDEIGQARKWIEARPGHFYEQLKSQYSLGNVEALILSTNMISSDIREKMVVEINGIPLSKPEFNGKFYAGRNLNIVIRGMSAEELEAAGIEGDPIDIKVTKWLVNSSNNSATYTTDNLSIAMPPSPTVTIIPTVEIATGISEASLTTAAGNSVPVVYDVQGRVSSGARKAGIYISKTASGATRKIVIK